MYAQYLKNLFPNALQPIEKGSLKVLRALHDRIEEDTLRALDKLNIPEDLYMLKVIF